MTIKIAPDANAPTAGVELAITQPLDDYDIAEVDMPVPRDVDGILVSQGFRDLVDDARALLDRELVGAGLEIVQLTGAICHAGAVYRPGLWLVAREKGAPSTQPMSPAARERLADIAEKLRVAFHLS
jgi:hypothetical protein